MPALDAITDLPTLPRAISKAIAAALRENSLLIVFSLTYVCVVNLTAAAYQVPYTSFHGLLGVYRPFVATCIAALAIAFILWLLNATLIRGLSLRSPEFWRRVTTDFMSLDRALQAMPVLLLWPLFLGTFSLGKSLMPLLQPFYLDQALIGLDRALHGGVDPWLLLQPLLGHPLITYLLDKSYMLWFFALYIALLLQAAATGDRRLRMRFLFSFILSWVLLGNVGAILLSSAGPCYYALIGGEADPFAPLMAYLNSVVAGGISVFGFEMPVELTALKAQAFLWSKYQTGQFVLGSGISAAPSMHIATTWLIARLCQARGGRLAIVAWIFLGLILIGSVHLGWHYAVDGYLAIAGAWAIWRATGWLLDRPAMAHFLWPVPRPTAAQEGIS